MSTQPRSRPAPLARAALLALLLLAPLVVAEWAARSSIDHLLPWLRTYHSSSEAKAMLFASRTECPQTLLLGTSISERSLLGDYLRGKHVAPSVRIGSTFNFGSGGIKPENMLMQWRWVRARGCAPDIVFVEVSPVALNRRYGGWPHDAPFLTPAMWASLPDGFQELRGYSTVDMLERVTARRLLLLRRRRELIAAMDAKLEWGATLRGPAPRTPYRRFKGKPRGGLPLDGELRGPGRGQMRPKEIREERRKRARQVRKGKQKHEWAEFHLTALEVLHEEIGASGAVAVFHVPPVTDIYRDMLVEMGAKERWCAVVAHLEDEVGVRLHDSLASPDYPTSEFRDWYHLSATGSQRWADALTTAARIDAPTPNTWCP